MTRQGLISRLYLKALPSDRPPYRVDDQAYKRFDQRNNLTVGRPNWDESVIQFSRQAPATRATHIRSGRPGYGLQDYSLFLAGGVTVWSLDTSINHANRGLTSWGSLGAKLPPGIDAWSGSPEAATGMVKRVARYFGADLVGIAPLDRRWIFSHAWWAGGTHKEIVFDSVAEPEETEDQ